jgi:hypothetical protein
VPNSTSTRTRRKYSGSLEWLEHAVERHAGGNVHYTLGSVTEAQIDPIPIERATFNDIVLHGSLEPLELMTNPKNLLISGTTLSAGASPAGA